MTKKVEEVFRCPTCNNHRFDIKQRACPISGTVMTYEECMKCGYKKIASVNTPVFPGNKATEAVGYFGAFMQYGNKLKEKNNNS